MFEDRENQIMQLFESCKTPDLVYQKIIYLGSKLSPLNPSEKNSENIVEGCQSQMYLSTTKEGDLIYFKASSDALISAGLAHLLISIYSASPAEMILTTPPTFLEKLHIPQILSPSRSNGLFSMHLKMKKDVIKFLV